MAKYRVKTDCYVGGHYIKANSDQPAEVTVPDDHEPSRNWEPMDEHAKKAMKALEAKDAKRASAK